MGEASNPGPRQSQEHVSDELLDALERDLVGREVDVEEARGSFSRHDECQTTQVDWGESVSFDMTVADSPDEGGTAAPSWDPRGRRVERSECLSRRTRRRVRRVQDSDNDTPVMQVDPLPHEHGMSQVGQRRVVLVPQNAGGTADSIQDREPPTPEPSAPVSTLPASSGAVRRLVLVNSQQTEPSGVAISEFASGVARGDQNSFAALRELEEVPDRRSELMSEVGSANGDENDTDSMLGASEADQEAVVLDPTPAEGPVEFVPRDTQNVAALASLDPVDLREVFSCRASVLHSIPHFLKGAFRGAVRVALKAVLQGYQTHSVARTTQGWKMLMLLPRLLLHRPLRGGKVSRKKFQERFQRFHEGRWTELLAESVANAQKTHQTSVRRRHRQRDDGRQRQLDRALRLVHMGELSAARQVLESADVAPGTLANVEGIDEPSTKTPSAKAGVVRTVEAQ